ncbi:hypothetical protein BC828DRAFT_405785 [Blastocladiella britannica]|nr:hypothetical protein BC828DRAFT_405785 [Blastocladiella britannica]
MAFLSQVSRPALYLGVGFGVAIPCITVGYFLRDSAPPIVVPADARTPQPSAVVRPPPPPPMAAAPVDPLASMTREQCENLLARTNGLLQNAIRERTEILHKIRALEDRMQLQK